jgi:hypothetical protein
MYHSLYIRRHNRVFITTGRAVKGRNEPCAVGGVAWVVASLNNCELEDVSRPAWNNSVEMFNLHELMDEEYHKDIAARDASAAAPGQSAEAKTTPAPAVVEVNAKEKKIKTLQKKVSYTEH